MTKTDANKTEATGTDRERVKVARRGAGGPADQETTGTERERVKVARRGAGDPADTTKFTAEVSTAVRAALDKKAVGVVVLDLRNAPAFTDFFILCSGNSQRQVKAIADAVEEALRAGKVRPSHVEGYDRADWVLMDFFTFIVHVFTPQTRSFYALERLWGDAERIDVTDDTPGDKTTRA